jgi:parvulin-like peptidyl-prolyl isomerase
MRQRIAIAIILALGLVAPGCRQAGIIAEGGDFQLTVEQLRFEIGRLGPSSSYEDTYESRHAVVMNLAARSFLADEAEQRGYGGDNLAKVVADAEKQAVADVYRRWKIDNRVVLPRIKTKPWIGKLDRKLHIEDLTFLVYPIAEEALHDLRNGTPISSIEEDASGREDIRIDNSGWVVWKDLPREVAQVVFRLGVGEVSDIMPATDGYHLFYLLEEEPLGAGSEILSVRSKRFVKAMEEEKLQRGLQNNLASKYHVRFPQEGLADGLKAFAISFAGERPPDILMAGVAASYPGGQVTVGDLFSAYIALPDANRPYVGDYHGLSDFALGLIMPDLEALAGYEVGLDRSPEVRFAARTAREDALIPFMEDYFKSEVTITPEDIEEYYNQRKSDLYEPGRYHTARIVLSTWEAAAQAERQIQMGADFGDVAARLSEDERSAPYGGDAGWLSDGLVAVYDSVLAGMKPGDVSRPFKTYSGIEILKLLERVDRRYLSLEEAVPSIRMFITNTRANDLLAEFVTRKEEELDFYVNEDLLRTVSLPEPEYARKPYKEAGALGEEEGEEEEAPAPLPKIR